MDAEEIKILKETVASETAEAIDPLEGDAIADMAESAGWKAMTRKANKIMADLLEPIDSNTVPSDANLLLIGANTLANAKALKIFRDFIKQATSERDAKRLKMSQKTPGVSKPEA